MATKRLCSIDGCGKPHRARGWCIRHYIRWSRHGDPAFGSEDRPTRGDLAKWLLAHVDYQKDGCLIWPFGKDPNGYGQLRFNGKTRRAHRVMCEEAHGAAPSHRHQAAHACGNGHLGCVNPMHLRWATAKENNQDKIDHGTSRRGAMSPQAKITEESVHEIRDLRRGGAELKEIAERFGITPSQVGHIAKGRSWAWL